MFAQKEQDEIINDFLDAIKIRDYIREGREKRNKCKCMDCKKHQHYCTCIKTIGKEEELEERLETNDLCLYDVDKLVLSSDRIFPLYDSVKHVKVE